MPNLPVHFVILVEDALLKSIWRKKTLAAFLRRHRVPDTAFAGPDSETKRELLARLLPELEITAEGQQIIKQMAVTLADQIMFPDLDGWEDTPQKIKAATASVSALKKYLSIHKDKAEESKAQAEALAKERQRQQEAVAARQTLDSLSGRLTELSKTMGTQDAGYQFQNWFYDLVDVFEVPCRRPYVSQGRQIDGSVTVEGTTYLTELKFTREQAAAPDIDSFLAKVNDKADNTMGVFVSMSGFSTVAIQQASGRKTPLILMDSNHTNT